MAVADGGPRRAENGGPWYWADGVEVGVITPRTRNKFRLVSARGTGIRSPRSIGDRSHLGPVSLHVGCGIRDAWAAPPNLNPGDGGVRYLHVDYHTSHMLISAKMS